MTSISTYVFFDIETTGLPFQERNQTKIIEASFVAALRKDIAETPYGSLPPVSKLTFVLNPQKSIHPEVVTLTGLSNKLLVHAPVFRQKFASIYSFLEDLPKPVCLVAHNGNTFDYKILLAECIDANVSLPRDLLCCDSLIGFRKIMKESLISYKSFKPAPQEINPDEDIFTDDEEEWPDINVSQEQWNEIDDICLSLSDISCDDEEALAASSTASEKKETSENKRENVEKKIKLEKRREVVIQKVFSNKSVKSSFKLTDLYKRLFNKDENNAHRAEVDCLMLLNCVVAMKNDFLQWSDKSCKLLSEVKPLQRYWGRK